MQTILVVDDENAFLDILELILRRAGYQTVRAGDGKEALTMIEQCRPDLALLDDMMPGMNGGDVCLAVKTNTHMKDMPVILYSAGQRVRDKGFVKSVRADDVLFKPFKPDDVLKAVRRFLGGAA